MAVPTDRTHTDVITLSHPGRILDVVMRCVAARIAPGRSGWSTRGHLGHDLHRHYGVHVPDPALERALRTLVSRRRVIQRSDAAGTLWYRAAG
jgi:hypothetical protein